jgi:hypothetical protein
MECLPNNHPALMRYRRTAGQSVGVDENHRCTAGICTYWSDGRHSLFICRVGLHVHRCNRFSCELAVAVHDGEYTCPVSGYCQGSAYAHYATRDSKDRFVNTCTWRPSRTNRTIKKNPKTSQLRSAVVRNHIALILQARKRSSCRERMLRSCLHRGGFQTTIAAVIASYGLYADNAVDEHEHELAASITRYIPVLRAHLTKSYSDLTLVAVVLSFLTCGLGVRGVVIFPVVPYVAERAPNPVAYALVPGLQCRAMSNATRSIKSLFLRANAIPPDLVFPGTAGEHAHGVALSNVGAR